MKHILAMSRSLSERVGRTPSPLMLVAGALLALWPSVSFAQAPPRTTMIAPSGTIPTVTPTYQWLYIATATDYLLQVNRADGKIMIQTYYTAAAACPAPPSNCAVTPTTTLGAASYTVWVRTFNNGVLGPWSTGLGFTVVPQADLSVSQTDTVDPIAIKNPANYTVTVTNAGPSPAINVSLTDTIPGNGTLFRSGTGTGVTCSELGGVATCSLGNIAVGASKVVAILVSDPNDTTQILTNTVTVSSSTTGDPNLGDNSSLETTTWVAAIPIPVPGNPIGPVPAAPPPTFDWSEVVGATDYALEVRDAAGIVAHAATYPSSCALGICTASPGMTFNPGTYNWYVRARNATGYSKWTAGSSFSVTVSGVVPPTQAPVPVSPVTTQTGTLPLHPAFTWNEALGSTSYVLQVNQDGVQVALESFPAAGNCNGLSCTVTLTTGLGAGAHKWWVRGLNAAGSGPWSSPARNFTVSTGSAVKVPPAPTPTLPNGAGTPPQPTFAWTQASNPVVASYVLQINTQAGFTVYVNSSVTALSGLVCSGPSLTGNCTVTPSGLNLSPGTYQWWVRAQNSAGLGAWSTGLTFSIP